MTIDDLNAEQLAVVRHGDGPMRVIAGAGTGKTQTLTHRFAYLVQNGIREDRILCLTYNRKAARELERRILVHFTHGYRKPWVKTFHSFCLSLIQEWALIDQLPEVEVLEGQKLRAFVNEVVEAIPDEELIVYSGTLSKRKLASAVISFGSQVRDLLLSPEEVQVFVRQVEPTPGRLHDLALAHRIVAEAQTTRGFHDFASMGYEAVRRLETDSVLLVRTRKRFDHLLVDEFQDTNFGQFRLIQLLAGETGNVCVVGDGNQAIYAFRGGQSRFINEFEAYFPSATTYVLGTNYRSGQRILDAANAVIQVNEGDDPIVLRAIDASRPGVVTLTPSANPQLEAAHIVRTILEMTRRPESPVRFADIAILLRSTERNSGPFERALASHGIPFRAGAFGGENTEAILDVLAALRLIAGPQRWTDAARMVAGANQTAAIALRRIEQRQTDRDRQDALLSRDNEGLYGFTVEELEAVRACQGIAAHARQYAHLSPPDALYKAMVMSRRLHRDIEPDTATALRSFLDQATGLADAGGTLHDLAVQLSAGYGDLPWHRPVQGAGVSIFTVHAAKGLEWPVVFVPALSDGEFPLLMKHDPEIDTAALLDWASQSGTVFSESERRLRFLEEERRLVYVAITRAQQELHLSYPMHSAEGGKLRPSPFIAEAGLSAHLRQDDDPDRPHPPASMADLAGQLRTRRTTALDTTLESADFTSQLAALMLEQWAASRDLAGARPLRPRVMPSPFAPGVPLRLSYSQIDLYQECPRKYFISRMLGLVEDDEPAALTFGSIIHSALHEINNEWKQHGRIPDDVTIEQTLDSHWPESAFPFETQNRQLRRRALAMLTRYFDWERTRAVPRKPVAIEEGFRVSFGDHLVSGRIDAVLESDDGTIEIIDFKTSKRERLGRPEESLQLFIYDHAHRQQHRDGTPKVSFLALRHDDDRAFVTGSTWDERQSKGHFHTDESRQVLETVVDDVIAQMSANAFDPKPSYKACNSCAFRWLCPAGESV